MAEPLSQLLQAYQLERTIRRGTADQYGYVIRSLERFLGRPATTDDFTSPTINSWIVWLQDSKLSQYTVAMKRGQLLVLWRYAFQCELVADLPKRIRKVSKGQRIIRTWTPEEFRHLLVIAAAQPGKFRLSKFTKAGFWDAWLRVSWDTGLRPCDQWRLEASWIAADGTIDLVQHKVNHAHTVRLRPETMAAVQRFMLEEPGRRFVFPAVLLPRHFGTAFTRLAACAGLTGTPKTIRSSSATELERLHPGTGWKHLGHRAPDIAPRHYLGGRAFEQTPLPPL